MKNIQIIKKENINEFIVENIWSTLVFKNLHNTKGSIIDLLMKRLEVAPVFFYELSHPRERNHLTSFYRFIAYREYENKYIQDLYYFHELIHLVSFDYNKDNSFEMWKNELNENELIASLYSEAFIYLVVPNLVDKTFPDLWIKKFMSKNYQTIKPINLWLDFNLPADQAWLDKYMNEKFDFLTLELNNWPTQIQNIINERRLLRTYKITDNLEDKAQNEIQIIKYNGFRDDWLMKWSPYYKEINNNIKEFLLSSIFDEDGACLELINFIKLNSNSEGVPFAKILNLKQ